MPTRFQFRRANASAWTSSNPTLAAGELGYELDTNKFKIGNGTDSWTALDYAGGGTVSGIADPTETWSPQTLTRAYQGFFRTAAYGGGRWVAMFDDVCATATSANGEWTWTPVPDANGYLRDLAYGNGLWACTNGATLLTTTDPTKPGAWKNGYTVFNSALASSIAYHNGLWVAITAEGSSTRIYTCNDPSNDSIGWTPGEIFTNVDSGCWPQVEYLNETWVVAANDSSGNILIYSAVDATSTWTLEATIGPVATTFKSIGYSNEGYFISTEDAIWSCATIDGTWVKKVDWSDYWAAGPYWQMSVAYGDGKYVATGWTSNDETIVYTSSSLDSPFTASTVTAPPAGFVSGIWYAPIFNGEEWLGIGSIYTITEVFFEYPTIWAPSFTSPNLSALVPAKYDAGANSVSIGYGEGLRVDGQGKLAADFESVALANHTHETNDPTTTWDLQYEDTSVDAWLARVAYGDGIWVAVGQGSAIVGLTNLSGVIVTSPSANGPWTFNASDFSAVAGFGLHDVAYGNGYWVAINDDQIWTATDPTGTWTLNANVSTGGSSVQYANGIWAYFNDDLSTVYTTTTPDGYWYPNTFILDNVGSLGGASLLRFINGIWVIAGTPGNGTTYILSSERPWDEWTLETTFANNEIQSLGYSPEGYFVSNYTSVWSCTTLNGIWQQIIFWLNDDYLNLAYGGGHYVAAGSRTGTTPIILVSNSLKNAFTEISVPAPPDFGGFWYEPYFNGSQWVAVGSYTDISTYEHIMVSAPAVVAGAVEIIANSPLTYSSGTVALNYGTGLTVSSGTLAADFGTISGKVVQGNDSRLSDARTPTAHKTTHATGGTDVLSPSDIGAVPTSTTISTTAPLSGGGDLSTNKTLSIASASTSVSGAVQLTNSTSSTSTTTAATPNSVKTAYDLANAAVPKTNPIIAATFSKAGTLSTGSGIFKWYNDSGSTLTIGTIRATVGTAPTGSSLIVDINVADNTIYSTQANRPTIAISGTTATDGTKSTSTVGNGSYITVDIDQVGSTIAGSDLTVIVWLSYL